MKEVLGNFTSSQSASVLVAAPPSNRSIRVWSIFIMSDTTGIVSLLDGAGGAFRFEAYPTAGGGVNKDAPVLPETLNFGIFTVADGEALDVTTDISGNHAVHIIYEIVKSGP